VEWFDAEWGSEYCVEVVVSQICGFYPACISTCWATLCLSANGALGFSYSGICIGPVCG